MSVVVIVIPRNIFISKVNISPANFLLRVKKRGKAGTNTCFIEKKSHSYKCQQ